MLCENLLVELEASGLEEPLSPGAVAHLDECSHCSGLVADLKAIRAESFALVEAEPPARIWVSLRNQLESEGLIRESAVAPVAAGSQISLWTRLRPALAGAYLAVLLAVATLWSIRVEPVLMVDSETTIGGTQVVVPSELVPAAEETATPEIRGRNPVVTASYTKSLETIDNFIRLCEKTVREEPGNEAAREYLYDAYQQKAGLLAMSMERGAWGD